MGNFQFIDLIVDFVNQSEIIDVSVFFFFYFGRIFCGFFLKDMDICFLNFRVFC